MSTPSTKRTFGDNLDDGSVFKLARLSLYLPKTFSLPRASRRFPRRQARPLLGTDPMTLDIFAPRTAPAPVRTSADMVFGTVELLEKVIINLEEIWAIVRVQRVNTSWRSVIRESTHLQQKLFLCASSQPTEYLHLTEVATPLSDAYLDEVKNPDIDAHPELSEWTYSPTISESQHDSGITIYRLHPLLMCFRHPFDLTEVSPRYYHQWNYIEFTIDVSKMLSWGPGPWQSMPISEPPISRGQIEHNYAISYSSGASDAFRSGTWVEPNSRDQTATLGHLQELVLSCYAWENASGATKYDQCRNFRFTVEDAAEENTSEVLVAREHSAEWLASYPQEPITEILVRPKSRKSKASGTENSRLPRLSSNLARMQKSKFDIVCSVHPLLESIRISHASDVDSHGYMVITIDMKALTKLVGGSWNRASLLQPPCPRGSFKLACLSESSFTGDEAVTFGFLAKQLQDIKTQVSPVKLMFKGFVEIGAPEVVEARGRKDRSRKLSLSEQSIEGMAVKGSDRG